MLGELATELVDQQASVREDEHAFRPCRFDEAGGGDRLTGRGRMAEPVAANRAGIGPDLDRLVLLAFV